MRIFKSQQIIAYSQFGHYCINNKISCQDLEVEIQMSYRKSFKKRLPIN